MTSLSANARRPREKVIFASLTSLARTISTHLSCSSPCGYRIDLANHARAKKDHWRSRSLRAVARQFS
jgi:hypothetical protein